MTTHPRVNCPHCGKVVTWQPENRFRPFCSQRCKQIDLGAWASGKYRLSSAFTDTGEEAPESIDSDGSEP